MKLRFVLPEAARQPRWPTPICLEGRQRWPCFAIKQCDFRACQELSLLHLGSKALRLRVALCKDVSRLQQAAGILALNASISSKLSASVVMRHRCGLAHTTSLLLLLLQMERLSSFGSRPPTTSLYWAMFVSASCRQRSTSQLCTKVTVVQQCLSTACKTTFVRS